MLIAIYQRSTDAFFSILVYLGAWQLLSFFCHLPFLKMSWIIIERRLYGAFLGSIALAGLLVSISNDAVFMSFFGAALGIFYLIISIVEWERMKLITMPTIAEMRDEVSAF
ncbi:MAG: hypothetical protein ABI378_04020 [Chitinophagaceae bacterium]